MPDGQHGARDDSFDGETFGFNCDHSVLFAEESSVAPSHSILMRNLGTVFPPMFRTKLPTISFAQANTATSTAFSGHARTRIGQEFVSVLILVDGAVVKARGHKLVK